MSHEDRCDLPPVPVAEGAVTACGICSELYQAVFNRVPVPTLGGDKDATVPGSLEWVRLDQVPEAHRTIEAPEWGDPPVQSPNQLLPEPPEPEVEYVPMPARIEHMAIPPGPPAPLTLDLGSEVGIIIQPRPDQADGEVALNIVSFGHLTPEVVAWLLGVASEQLTKRIRVDNIMNGAKR